MDSRARILERIRQAIHSSDTHEDIEASFQALCPTADEPQSQALTDTPVQPPLSHVETHARFIAEARRNGAMVFEMQSLDDAQAWLEQQAQASAVAPQLHLSPRASAIRPNWGGLRIVTGVPAPVQSWGLVHAHTAMAETGTIMSLSRECPSSLLFLVERLVVLIDKQDIVRFQEDAWDRLLGERGLPRTVNLITGPSRTADIEQQIQIGAHGPRRTDYLIIDSLPGE